MKYLGFRPKLVLFDLCSTIIDTMESDQEALKWLLGEYNVEGPLDLDAIKTPGKTLHNSVSDLAPGDEHTFRANYLIALTFNTGTVAFPFPGAGRTISLVKATGAKVGYISNRHEIYEGSVQMRYPLLHAAFDVRQHAVPGKRAFGEHVIEKPDPRILDIALSKLGGKFKAGDPNILFVGDAKSDIEFAENCGITPVLFHSETANIPPKFIAERPDLHIVKNHTELQELLLSEYSGMKKAFIQAATRLEPNIAISGADFRRNPLRIFQR